MKSKIFASILLVLFSAYTLAKGNLATKPIKLPELVLGTDLIGYKLSQYEYNMETGEAYSLVIRSTGRKECAFHATSFFNNIWLRKVEAGGIEIKSKDLYELEYEDEGEAEIFFVPIKPGNYTFLCKGLAKRGMTGKFVVK